MDQRSELRILVVEDSETDQLLMERELRRGGVGFRSVRVDNRNDFVMRLRDFRPDIILCDFSLPQFNALDALEIAKVEAPGVPLIIVTGTLSDETAVETLKSGAVDYLLKERVVRLPSAIRNALAIRKSEEEREAARRLLKRNEEQLRVITNILPAPLAYVTPDFRFQFCNHAYEEWFGKDRREILGRHVREILGEDIFSSIAKGMDRLKRDGTLIFEDRLTIGETARYVSVALGIDSNGETKGLVCLINDLSDRKRYEEELKSAKELADSANRAKTQFLANMSHEMRTPLTAILGFAELLKMGSDDISERETWVDTIHRNGEHLKQLIDEILDLSKIEAGQLDIVRRRFAVRPILQEVTSSLYPLAKQKNLELLLSMDDSIPDVITSDPLKFRHILMNIVGNAIKFSDKGRILIRGQIMPRDGRRLLSIDVIDNGPGISDVDSRRLFQPFTQIDSSFTRQHGGTGLGLVLSRRFAQALGGDVVLARSVPGEGSTFTITIDPGPEVVQNHPTPAEETKRPPSSRPEFRLHGMRVLLAEDAPDNRLLMRRTLMSSGVQVDLAVNGEEAVRLALSRHYDVVLMDIEMPVMDGYQATAELRNRHYRVPILALTAHALDFERDRALQSGFDGFLTKPIKAADLLAELAKFKPQETPPSSASVK